MGTLLELANCTLDVLTHLVLHPAKQSLAPSTALTTRASERPLDVHDAILTTRRNLEVVLYYAAAQLGAWLVRPELFEGGVYGPATGDAEMDDPNANLDTLSVSPRERRVAARRESVSLAERLRRGMTGEMAGELRALIEKARGVLVKSKQVAGESAVDVTAVLVTFLNERVLVGA